MDSTNTITKEETLQRMVDRFWETIPPVWNRIRGNVRSIATDHFEMTVEQFHILRHIRRGCGSVSELATIQQISRSGMSQAVDILVEKGLITRQQSVEDRRYVRLELTHKGDDLLNAIFQDNRCWMIEKLAHLTSEEMNSVLGALDVLNETFYAAFA